MKLGLRLKIILFTMDSDKINCESAFKSDLILESDACNSMWMDNKTMQMMKKMGYKIGKGLGICQQGITQPLDISTQFGTLGYGFTPHKDLDFSLEVVIVKEKIKWLENIESLNFNFEKLQSSFKMGYFPEILSTSYDFCRAELLEGIVEAKEVFRKFDIQEINKARGRANPFEKIYSIFFMNRAALKLADIDAATNFMFTNIDQDIHHSDSKGPFYFADVCAGPGGFSEYIFWRKSWFFKGFGFTLRGEHDFQLNTSSCISPHSFQAFYGTQDDGDVCCPDNIADFKDKVLQETKGEGIHFMTSDGGFCVDGKEDRQEILSKNIYLCQCLVALEIVRSHGHFVTKMFDVFTRFSVGLIYLMYKCFKKVTILKPNSSRPANAERYLICSDLQNNADVETIKIYLRYVAQKLWEVKDNDELDVLEIVPLNRLKEDNQFFEFITERNNSIGESQIAALKKIDDFCKNPSYVDPRQDELRSKCLEFWKIPDMNEKRWESDNKKTDKFLTDMVRDTDWMKVEPIIFSAENFFQKIAINAFDWTCCGLYSSKEKNLCHFYAGFPSKTCKWQNGKWMKVKNLKLSRGTLLYGEIVKEVIRSHKLNNTEVNTKYSLHIIDAVYLGNVSMFHLRFQERMELIDIFAKSHNQEFQEKLIRVRKKPTFSLNSFNFSSMIRKSYDQVGYETILPNIGFSTAEELQKINSLLFLKHKNDQTLQSTFVLRMQLFLESNQDVESLQFLMKELESSS